MIQIQMHKSGIMFLQGQNPTLLLDQCKVTQTRGINFLYFWILMVDVSFSFAFVIAKFHQIEMANSFIFQLKISSLFLI